MPFIRRRKKKEEKKEQPMYMLPPNQPSAIDQALAPIIADLIAGGLKRASKAAKKEKTDAEKPKEPKKDDKGQWIFIPEKKKRSFGLMEMLGFSLLVSPFALTAYIITIKYLFTLVEHALPHL